MNTIDEQIYKILSKKDEHRRLISRESSTLEFKEKFNLGYLSRYSRIMASFANNKGGIILFGVKDSPRKLLGINFQKFNEIKQEKITSFLSDHFSPEIKWEIGGVEENKKYFGYIHVFKNNIKPVMCKKNSGKDLKNGEIYYRYRGQSKNIEYSELHQIINQAKEEERNNWMALIKQIANIGPENSALLDIIHGKIRGQQGTLLIDEKLIPKLSFIYKGKFEEGGQPTLRLIGDVVPAQISKEKNVVQINPTTDPNAPRMKLSDDKIKELYPWDYEKLTDKMRERYKNFKVNQKYHEIRKECIKNNRYAHRRFLDPDNPKRTHKDFYNPSILQEFDKHYEKDEKKECESKNYTKNSAAFK